MARPTKYIPDEILTKAKEYVADWEKIDAKYGGVVPTIEGMALHLDIHRETIRVWCKEEDKEEFSGIVKKMYAIQGALLVNKSLSGDLKEKTSGALLSRHHDYGERQHVDLTSSDGSAVMPKAIRLVAPEFEDAK